MDNGGGQINGNKLDLLPGEDLPNLLDAFLIDPFRTADQGGFGIQHDEAAAFHSACSLHAAQNRHPEML
ncbi:hypothetical protein D3C75_1193980 [compost metagenome]